ncbi:hypothetical protein [Photobacterium damselae]|uniref:hypothetical protein n=1 Tax=Photobacterium damselae TaxID=38293 RepID=UPI001F212EA2|nr:hypothetical protein [Photobacterium damselae]UKA04438.1 hypothetical protein IHC89_22715 [Photobacterium damselae subsp. damselae]
MFKNCSLEKQLSERHDVSFFFEELPNLLIWKIELDGVTWFELISTKSATTITMASKTFMLNGNTLVQEAIDMAQSAIDYTPSDIDENFCIDLQYPHLDSSTLVIKKKIIEAISLIANKQSSHHQYCASDYSPQSLESPERKLIKQIIIKAEKHYRLLVQTKGRDRNFEESLLTVKKRLDLK